MTTHHFVFCAVLAISAAVPAPAVRADAQQVSTTDDWCRDESWGSREGVCEVRNYTVAATGAVLAVDARPNGGIEVDGDSRRDIMILAKVVATARTEERARQIASAVRVDVTPEKVEADGPDNLGREEGWSVSYRLAVPEQTSLSLRSTNGGINISNVEGRIDFNTVNGGVKLSRLGGDVRGRTNNGGVDIELDGTTWQGEGLDVETHNGGVKLAIPDNYSAHLESSTVNGGFRVDIPMTVQGRINREINAQLGSGGPLVRVRTSNGGIKITRR
jgi:hypothetical protein